MPQSLADRLSAARAIHFVGRQRELRLFESALLETPLPFAVLFVYGPGGVGKTTLVQRYVDWCGSHNIPANRVDARGVEASPPALLAALRQSLTLPVNQDPTEWLSNRTDRRALIIDTFEALAPLEGWVRTELLPRLRADTLVVIAGREPPSASWLSDPGWQELTYVLPLRNLESSESRMLLERRNVPSDQHRAVLDFTHGHPLALSLVADVFAQQSGLRFEPGASPDVIRALLERLVQKAPSPAHRATLEACSLVRFTTESLLAELLGMQDCHDLFEWLCGLTFIEKGRRGVYPHDVAREALALDLRWRNPQWHAELLRRAMQHFDAQLQQIEGAQQLNVLTDYLFLTRDNPLVRPFVDWNGLPDVYTDSLRDSDRLALVSMVDRNEGPESAHYADYWIGHPLHETLVIRKSESGAPASVHASGFLCAIGLHVVTEQEREMDPAVAAACGFLKHRAPLRPGEKAVLFRFWMADTSYQQVSSEQSLILVNMVRHYLTTPGLAVTLMPCSNPDFWAPVSGFAAMQRVPEADFETGGRTYGVYAHDWRRLPPVQWLALLSERTKAIGGEPEPGRSREEVLVLSRADFEVSVRDALRGYSSLAAVRSNPLLRSRLVLEMVGSHTSVEERAGSLRAAIRGAAEALQDTPRRTKLFRAVHATYLDPAPSQELAADLLDLPFSTYRRHLTAGVQAIVDELWARELAPNRK